MLLDDVCREIDADPSRLMREDLRFFREWLTRRFGVVISQPSKPESPLGDCIEISDDEEPPPEIHDEAAASGEDKLAKENSGEEAQLHLIKAVQLAPSARRYTECAIGFLALGKHADANTHAEKAVNMNPDSAKAIRTRSQTRWMMGNSSGAYKDMCDAQRLDYDEEYDTLHAQMKSAAEEQSSSPPPSSIPSGIDMGQFMNNPAVMNMAQNLMSDPNLMQQLMQSMGVASRR